jgi:hypothetical protein
MRRPLHALLAALLVCFGAGAAPGAPEPEVLGFPREGFSIARRADWTFAITDGALLELRRGKASLWLRRDASAVADPATRLRAIVGRMGGERAKPAEVVPFPVMGGGEGQRIVFESGAQRQGFAFVSQPRGRRLELEWTLPVSDAALLAEVEQVLASLDVTPYENPRRHVDWKDGWSIDVPSEWKRVPAKHGWTVFGSGETPKTVIAVRRPPEEPTAAFEREGSALWKEVVGVELVGGEGGVGQLAGNAEGVTRTHQAIATWLDGKEGVAGYYRSEERSGWWVTVVCPDSHRTESCPEANAATSTFRASPDPGPRARAADEKFERADTPKVTFRSPARWKKVPLKPGPMRVAQYEVPGTEPAECVVYFFGAAQGGGLEDNLNRWKSQFQIEGTPSVKTEEVTPGVTATVLDVSGRYVAEIPPGSGNKVDKPGWRMFAAVILAPDGALYVKCAGPKATLEPAEAEFREWVRSFRVAK